MEHTPGPWHIEFECNVFGPNHRLVASAGGYQTNADDWHRIENEANARRIITCVNACEGINPEAVPDLLAACEKLIEAFNFSGGYITRMDDINLLNQALVLSRVAIAKARGTDAP
jgi:hypothetical protein